MLFDYQQQLKADIFDAWASGAQYVMPVLPTGGGKTTVFCHVVRKFNAPACIIAHRQELVSQASLALNREQLHHGIIAPNSTIKEIVRLHMDTHGQSFFSPKAPVRVAGVHTLAAREESAKDRWFNQVGLVVIDEGHHVLQNNIWGASLALFPFAKGLFPTAHAVRADGRGLGRGADGFVDRLVLGPHCRQLIDRGFLCDYRLVCAANDVDVSDVPVSTTGDFSLPKLRAAVHRSPTIVGDVVSHYLKFAAGKLGITFAVDIESASELANAYLAAGIPAAVITGDTPTMVRAQLMRDFKARNLLQLVSVDVLGEGVDVPAIEVVSMARPTSSFQLYSQQFGRSLRTSIDPQTAKQWPTATDAQRLAFIAASAKPNAIIIDHVGNWNRHGLPDVKQTYSLERPDRTARKKRKDAIALRSCLNPECLEPFEIILKVCPYCGTHIPPPAGRTKPEEVAGDLIELSPEALAALRGEVQRVDDAPRIPLNASPEVAGAIKKRHRERQEAQGALRAAIALWAGYQRHIGRDESQAYRLFFHQFDTDVLTAQSIGAKDARDLADRINAELTRFNVVELKT